MSAADLEIRPYRPGDEAGILALFNSVFAEDDPGYHARAAAAWRWEFLENPAGTQVVLGVEPGGRIVAQYACLPARVNLRGRDVCCGQGVDSVVAEEYRRGLRKDGAFLRTARFYFEHFGRPEHNAFGYGFPNTQAYRVGVKLLGYTQVHAPLITCARNLFDTTDDAMVGRGARQAGRIVELPAFDARVDRLWARLAPELPMAIRRDATYLGWRYTANPSADYTVFGLTAGGEGEPGGDELVALAVLRPDWTGPPILAVCEWMLGRDDEAAAARLMAHVVAHARASGQQRVELWLPPWHPQRAALEARGFLTEPSPCNLCIVIYEPDLDLEWVRSNWYFTIGDSDIF